MAAGGFLQDICLQVTRQVSCCAWSVYILMSGVAQQFAAIERSGMESGAFLLLQCCHTGMFFLYQKHCVSASYACLPIPMFE